MFKIDQHIEHLLLNHSCVIVPGFGGFVVHNMPARFDKSDGTMLPPCTTVGFNPQLILNDSLLIQSYIETYDMSYPEAQREVEQEVNKLRELISANGSFEIHSVGTLSLNTEGNYEFEPCQAGILVPRYYGLSGINTIDEETFLISQDISNTYEDESEDENTFSHTVSTFKKVAVACLAVLIIAAIPFLAHNNQAQQMFSSIDISFLTKLIPNTEVKSEKPTVIEAQKTATAPIKAKSIKSTQEPTIEKAAEQVPAETPNEEFTGPSYTVVLAAQVSQKNAEIYVDKLTKEGLKDLRIIGEGKSRKVVMGTFKTEEEAQNQRRALANNEEFSTVWVLTIK